MINIQQINEKLKQEYGADFVFKTKDELATCEFISRNYPCLDPQYIEQARANQPYLKFEDLRKVYLLDKEIRLYIFNAIEEIEVSLKSIMYLDNTVNFFQDCTYDNRFINEQDQRVSKVSKIYRIVDAMNQKPTKKSAIFGIVDDKDPAIPSGISPYELAKLKVGLSFSDVSKLIGAIYDLENNNKRFLLNLSQLLLRNNSFRDLRNLLYTLSKLRNGTAHHNSIINLVNTKIEFNNTKHDMKNVLAKINQTIMNMRQKEPSSSKISQIEDIIADRTEKNRNFRQFLGYKNDFSDRIS